jgi:hypothetical protein
LLKSRNFTFNVIVSLVASDTTLACDSIYLF